MIEGIRNQLTFIGEDPDREGLKETPHRVLASWRELFAGYQMDPASVFKTFETGVKYDQMVVLKEIQFYSTCEHHMLPFYGKAHVAYIPGPSGRVIGVSKLARLVDIYARRLQIQERLTSQITDDLMYFLEPKGAACVIEAVHMCIRSRGCGEQESVMTTSSLRGAFLDCANTRMEFLKLIERRS